VRAPSALTCLLPLLLALGAAAHEPEEEAEAAPPSGLFGTSFLEGWRRSIGAGVSGAKGNTTSFDANVDVLGDAEDEWRRWKLRAAYFVSKAEEAGGGIDRTKNQVYIDLTRDFRFPEWPVFLFVQGRFDYDPFEAWDYRLAGSLGAGYDLYDSDPFDLRARFGAGVNQTFGVEFPAGGDDDELSPEALVGLEAVWRPREGQTLATAHTVYPDLSSLGEFRLISTADWILEVSDWIPLALKLGLLFEHESEVEPPAKQSDLKYAAALLYSF